MVDKAVVPTKATVVEPVADIAEVAARPEDKYPRFISTTGGPIMVPLLNGHTVSVTDKDEGTPLHPRFHKKAVELGAMPVEVYRAMQKEGVADGDEVSTFDRQEIIIRNISQMVEQAELNPDLQKQYFTNDGRPDAQVISTRCGFKVTAGERDRAWDSYQGEVA